MPEFYMIIARKYFPEFRGGVPPVPVSYANGDGTWVGCLGVSGVSRLRSNEPVLLNQCSMFYTAWKMRLLDADCVYIIIWLRFWGYPGSAPTLRWGTKRRISQTLCAHLTPNSGGVAWAPTRMGRG